MEMGRLWFVCLFAIFATAGAVPMNMNGDYTIANPNPDSKVPFSTDYSKKNAEYFDVYTPPIRTVYGEVFWWGPPNFSNSI